MFKENRDYNDFDFPVKDAPEGSYSICKNCVFTTGSDKNEAKEYVVCCRILNWVDENKTCDKWKSEDIILDNPEVFKDLIAELKAGIHSDMQLERYYLNLSKRIVKIEKELEERLKRNRRGLSLRKMIFIKSRKLYSLESYVKKLYKILNGTNKKFGAYGGEMNPDPYYVFDTIEYGTIEFHKADDSRFPDYSFEVYVSDEIFENEKNKFINFLKIFITKRDVISVPEKFHIYSKVKTYTLATLNEDVDRLKEL